jgi:hypothetical protein
MPQNTQVRISDLPLILGTRILAVTVICLAMTACSSTTPVAYQGLSSVQQLQQVKDDEKPFQYRNADTRLGDYTKILIDPVTIYDGHDAQFGSVSTEDRQIIADYMTAKFPQILGEKFPVVQTADPTAIRLHLTLTGIEKSTPVLSTISHLTPMGIVLNGGLQAAGSNGTSFGSISYAVELSDSVTNKLLYAYVTKQTPDALDVTASIGYLDAAKEGIRIGAKHLQDELAKNGFGAATSQNDHR